MLWNNQANNQTSILAFLLHYFTIYKTLCRQGPSQLHTWVHILINITLQTLFYIFFWMLDSRHSLVLLSLYLWCDNFENDKFRFVAPERQGPCPVKVPKLWFIIHITTHEFLETHSFISDDFQLIIVLTLRPRILSFWSALCNTYAFPLH